MENSSSSQLNESAFQSLSKMLSRSTSQRGSMDSRRTSTDISTISSTSSKFAVPGESTPLPGAPMLARHSMSGSLSSPTSQSQPQVPTTWHFPCYGYQGAVQCDGDSWSAHHTYENSVPISETKPMTIPGSGTHPTDRMRSSESGVPGATSRIRGASMGERPRPVMPPGSPSRILYRISQNMQNANLTDASLEMAMQALP